MTYLTEKSLRNYLCDIYRDWDWIHDKAIKESNIKNRLDYRNEQLKIIVEFDGYLHYTNTKTILSDYFKDEVYSKLSYNVIRIPYFVQLSTEVIKHLFKIEYKFEQAYPHGFIDKKAILPSNFNELGIERFKNDLEKFSFIKNEIISSLRNKIEELKDIRLVLPRSLFYLV